MVVFRRVRRKRRETLDERVQRVIDKHFQEFTPFQIEELVIELGKPLRETLKWALVNVWFPCVLSGSHDHYFKELRQNNGGRRSIIVSASQSSRGPSGSQLHRLPGPVCRAIDGTLFLWIVTIGSLLKKRNYISCSLASRAFHGF